MPLLRADAEKLSNNTLISGVVEEIIDRDAMFGLMPFTKLNSKALVYNRENGLSAGDFIGVGDTVNEGAATFTEVTTKLSTLIGDVKVNKFLAETMGDMNDQVAIQIQAKAKALSRQFRAQIANGAAGANAFDGLPNLVTGAQTLSAGTNGGACDTGNAG